MSLFRPELQRGVSVLTYGADPKGIEDSTAAFNAARTDTDRSNPIRIPTGTYLIDGNGLDIASRMWIGDVSSGGTPESVLRARTSTTSFLVSSSRTHLENLVFDANRSASHTGCDYALRLINAHNSTLYNVDCRNAKSFAFFLDETQVAPMMRVTCRLSANGIKVLGANGLIVMDMRLLDNDNLGGDWIGIHSGETTASGQISIFGFHCINNGGDGVRIRGITNGMMSGGRIENNGGDGIRIDDNAADILIDDIHIYGNGSDGEVAIRIVDGKICTFRAIEVGGSVSSYEQAIIAEPSQVIQFYGANGSSSSLPLVYTDGYVDYTAFAAGANLKGSSAPTVGQFRRGHIVWNRTPTALSNRGWRCTTAGSPGTWNSF